MGRCDRDKALSRKKNECVRKRGPSLRRKAEELGELGDIVTFVFHQDPVHSTWRIGYHIPDGQPTPDFNSIVSCKENAASSGRLALIVHTQFDDFKSGRLPLRRPTRSKRKPHLEFAREIVEAPSVQDQFQATQATCEKSTKSTRKRKNSHDLSNMGDVGNIGAAESNSNFDDELALPDWEGACSSSQNEHGENDRAGIAKSPQQYDLLHSPSMPFCFDTDLPFFQNDNIPPNEGKLPELRPKGGGVRKAQTVLKIFADVVMNSLP